MNIEDVDWASLKHAYGEATDVPGILGALRSADVEDRNGAFYDMYGSLCHQGSVYEATAAAVPFLVDIVVEPGYPDREDLLSFLGHVCHGGDTGHAAALAAMAVQVPRLTPLLRDGDPGVRLRVLWALSSAELREAADDVARLTADPEPSVRAGAWLALGEMDAGRLSADCDEADGGEADGAVRLAWALARASRGGAEVADTLTGLLRDGESLPRLHEWTRELTRDSPLAHCETLLASGDASLELLDVVCALLVAETDEDRAMSQYEMLLAATFGPQARESLPTSFTRDDLDPRQRRVLAAIAASDAAWAYGSLWLALSDHGIEAGFDRGEFADAFGDASGEDKWVLILRPRQVPAAVDAAHAVGREEWLDTPFVFLNRWTKGIESAIPEDLDDFPPEVMSAARVIAQPLMALVARHQFVGSYSWAFYPQLDGVAAAETVFAELGYTLLPPDLTRIDDEPEPVTSGGDDQQRACVPFTELTPALRADLDAFVECLAEGGWSEVRQSYAFAKSMADGDGDGDGGGSVGVTPLALGRRFGTALHAQVGFHVERAVDGDGGDDVGLVAYLGLVLDEQGGETYGARLAWHDARPLFAALAGIDMSGSAVDTLRSLTDLAHFSRL
ncbi:HEAT repeat domain-containing protein [Streptomyces sp. NBS 14/10]|uniref:HEAT repeat domain-containing protein n=1 Tax=Streptomyces sp. NBS 14/10 TaxID=1945643 RepID=UPI000B7DDA19|nr:HEAT repeat domain-containing protein [Streptomyces sp. NBS 14/10]KAK1181396.1 HEAT repeat domain-containing protein [Streptomyces sp. NBS 14/10]